MKKFILFLSLVTVFACLCSCNKNNDKELESVVKQADNSQRNSQATARVSADCPPPTNVRVDALAEVATVSFYTVDEGDQYQVSYREKGDSSIFDAVHTQNHLALLSNLKPNTEYELQVRTLCGSIGSARTPLQTFTTSRAGEEPSCQTPTYIEAFAIETSASITFRAVEGASIQYMMLYKKQGAADFTANVFQGSITSLDNLERNTTYEFKIRTLCGEIGSAYSALQQFTTAANTPSCDPPSSFEAAASATSASISFPEVERGTQYQILYKKVGAPDFKSDIFQANYTALYDLEPSTTYEFKIRTLCGEIGSAYSALQQVTTAADVPYCLAPTNVQLKVVANSVEVTFTKNAANGTATHVYYKTDADEYAKTVYTTTESVTIPNLIPNTKYTLEVRTLCGSAGSEITPAQTFTTGAAAGSGSSACTKVGFKLTLDDYGSETSYAIVDANNSRVGGGGTFSNGESGAVKTDEFCLADGCYVLTVNDSYGDGTCCAYGNGSFQILDSNGSALGNYDGNFGKYKSVQICVSNGKISLGAAQSDAKSRNLSRKKQG